MKNIQLEEPIVRSAAIWSDEKNAQPKFALKKVAKKRLSSVQKERERLMEGSSIDNWKNEPEMNQSKIIPKSPKVERKL